MTEILLLLLAFALVLACAVFVAAEFSLTTVERGDLERAAEAGERGAEGALKAVRRLTFQLSGAQLGITVTSFVIGMLAEPSLAALLRGPLEAIGLPGGAVSTVATLLGVTLSTVVLMVIGELVPKNWAISSPWPSPRSSRARSAASPPPSARSSAISTARRTVSSAASAWSPRKSWPPPGPRRNWSRWHGTRPARGRSRRTRRSCSYGPCISAS